MSKTIDTESALQRREERRKNSIVAQLAGRAEPEQAEPLTETQRTVTSVPLILNKVETKSRRKQILLQPSVHDRAAEKCAALGISMNDVINQLLDAWIKE